MKRIIKWFLSAKKLAKWSADGVQTAINSSSLSQYADKYGEVAKSITEVQTWLVEMLKDGKIDDIERAEIEERLVPVFDKLLEVI